MSVLTPEEMTRADLIATLGATEAKLKASQDRVGVLEARVKELVGQVLALSPSTDNGYDDIHDD